MSSTIEPCPQCGRASSLGTIGGLCPSCVARSAMNSGVDWLANHAASETESELPIIIGWRITNLIGAGGMGRVYRAESDHDGRVGALKILDAKWATDPVIAARFEAEAGALRQLEHEHVVRVLDTTESEDGRFCLVTEFVDGCDLGRLLRAEKLTQDRALDIFHKVCSAVAHAHEQGFVHRDVKPANILIGRDGTVKLVDFGLAKDVTLNTATHSIIGGLTSTTDQFGTAYYIAPERFARRQNADPTSDVFSLGVLLYHLLAGQMPLGNYTPLSQLSGLSAKWDRVLAEALEADPAKRMQSVLDLDQSVAGLWREHQAGTDRLKTRRRLMGVAAGLGFTMTAAALGAWWQHHNDRAASVPVAIVSPKSATTEHPWTNTLGMSFVPVPGTKVLFSVYETRRRDVEPFIDAYLNSFNASWLKQKRDHVQTLLARSMVLTDSAGNRTLASSWSEPGWAVTGDHPACYVGIRDAQLFCLWLTWKEQAQGRLQAGQRYRLPTDAEWLTACGGSNGKIHAGNLAGTEARDADWPKHFPTFIESDPFPRTAPVVSFPAEANGLYDLSGNVSEWVVDHDENTADPLVLSAGKLRGPNFADGRPMAVSFDHDRPVRLASRLPIAGFRVVLECPTQKSFAGDR